MKNILYILFLSVSISFSQEQASNWYFGENAGIQFNTLTGDVTVLDDGQLSTREGCASISDEDGNLLFYTDGSTVYNRTHNVMFNGTGLFGDESSTQSAIVVPKPEDADIYYIFTVDNEVDGINHGMNYSEVDMTADGGLGAVTRKNIRILDECSEKITAVLKDCESASIWVLAFASLNGDIDRYNTFHAFEVSDTGVNITPVRSTFGISVTDGRGYLKTSPDGTKLACANTTSGMYIYDFDTDTGIVSNQLNLTINTSNNFAYGVEFSPNNQYLYIHSYNDSRDGPSSNFASLTQFDLFATDIVASQILLDDRNLYRGGLQLGPNGKIYRALSQAYTIGIPFLGVINNPNAAGAASNYDHFGVDLGGVNCTQGFPPFITSFFNQKIDIIQNGSNTTYLPLCDGDSYTLMADDFPGATYTWQQDGVILPEADFDLIITESGTYDVLIELTGDDCETYEGEAIVEYFEYPTITNTVLLQCDEDGVNDGLTIFNLDEANDSFIGSDPNLELAYFSSYSDAEDGLDPITNPAFPNTSNPQILFALITNTIAGCETIAELSLQASTTQSSDVSLNECDEDGLEDGFFEFNLNDADVDILAGLPAGLTISYYEDYDDALLEQNELSNVFTNTSAFNQIIYARVENMNACFGISEIELNVYTSPEVEEDEAHFYCLNFYPETITLESGAIDPDPTYTYLWSNGDTTSSIQVNEIGVYTVIITNQYGCETERDITVEASNIATFDSIDIEDGFSSNTITVYASGEGEYEYALYNDQGPYTFYQSNNVFTDVSPGGIYTVTVRDIKNDCGIVEQIISVISFPKFFTPNNDGTNDYWMVHGVNEIFQPNTKIKIFNRYGKLLKELSPLGKGWDGTLNGEILPNDDYWFAVTLQDGREVFNHFSLKR